MSPIHFVWATPAQVEELKQIDEAQEKINLKKEWIQYRYELASHDCYAKFFTVSCLKDARNNYRAELLPVRQEELAMHEHQRELKEALKNERDLERQAESADPNKAKERANNRKAFDEKQQKRADRAAELEERRKDAAKRSEENHNASPF